MSISKCRTSFSAHRPTRTGLLPALALVGLSAACTSEDPTPAWQPGSTGSATTAGTTGPVGAVNGGPGGTTMTGTSGGEPSTGSTSSSTTGVPTTGGLPVTTGSTTGAPTTGTAGVTPDAGGASDASIEGGMADGSVAEGGMADGSAADAGMADGGAVDGSMTDGAMAAGDGGADASDAEQDSGPPREDLGQGDGSDVVTIGDSWMQYDGNGGGIERALEDASDQDYRNYAAAGAKLFKDTSFFFGLVRADAIPKQYATAKQESADIKTVVMTGGGNDVLLEDDIDDCNDGGMVGPKCAEQIGRMGEGLAELWQEMGDDGVQDIVYIEYSSKGTNPAAVLLGAEQLQAVCADVSPARCHFVLADDHMGREHLLDDDPDAELVGAEVPIHPTEEGCDIMGRAVYDLMVAEGMRR